VLSLVTAANKKPLSWRESDLRREVRRLLAKAVYSGKVRKPERCEACGSEPGKPRLHGHHTDYKRPLDVIWLCRPCHHEEHRR